jgi:glycosyltransferase involved in cell wall biosynthesis
MIGEADISERVRLVGWVSGAEKLRLLSSARLVVVPSRQETFGLVALEALASATPVIAFDIPCLREVVPPGCGWLVTPFDVDGLAGEIAARYDAMAELGDAGRAGRVFASRFDWDLLARHQMDEYRQALPKTPGPATRPKVIGGRRI